jgi:hypothetical protein
MEYFIKSISDESKKKELLEFVNTFSKHLILNGDEKYKSSNLYDDVKKEIETLLQSNKERSQQNTSSISTCSAICSTSTSTKNSTSKSKPYKFVPKATLSSVIVKGENNWNRISFGTIRNRNKSKKNKIKEFTSMMDQIEDALKEENVRDIAVTVSNSFVLSGMHTFF